MDILSQEDIQIDIEEKIDDAVASEGTHILVVHNDDLNTFEWVIESLMKVCFHSEKQAEQCVMMIHYNGKAEVKHGDVPRLEPMKDGLVERGIAATIERV